MRKHYLFITVFVICLFGCASDFSQFNDEALRLAKNDNRIVQNEYEILIKHIEQSDDKGFNNFKTDDGKIDNSKVVTYLVKFFKAKKLEITAADIWQPENIDRKSEKFNINVFIENSVSMDGYVNDNSTFKTTIFKLLTDLMNFPSADSLNLNYINTKSIRIKVSASRDDIDDFYKRLNPKDYKSAGGIRKSTDIEKMLKQLLDITNSRNLSVFISDCVFSPGKNDAKKYLDGQYAAIYNDFLAAKNHNPDLSVIILQCTAKFEGTYYDYFDAEHKNMNSERPYYIWFIGKSDQILSLVDNKIFELIKNGYKNKIVIQSIKDVSQPNFKILYRPRIGDFDSKDLAQKIISGASASKDNQNKGIFGFRVAVDFSKSLQDLNFFSDTNNYELNDKKYNLKIDANIDKSDPSLSGFTHVLKLQTSELKDEPITIEVVGKVPNWVFSSTSPDDTRIDIDNLEKQKTFGFKYLVEGVCDAFYPKSKTNTIYSINITIKK